MTEDELVGVLRASVRLANREGWKQELLISEFTRRREQAKDAEIAATGRVSFRAGEFPGEELAVELAVSPLAAAAKIETAKALTGRLPATLAGMADGLIDPYRASGFFSRHRRVTSSSAPSSLAAALTWLGGIGCTNMCWVRTPI